MNYPEKIDLVGSFLNFISHNNDYPDHEDIRNITIDGIAQTTQSYFVALCLANKLTSIKYVKENISTSFESEDLKVLNFSYDGFIKDSYFLKFFVFFENHIRQIGSFYEANKNELNHNSISQTIKNIINNRKLEYFSTISNYEIDVLLFFCYLRNTMHNIGFQSQDNQEIEIQDNNSIIDREAIKLKLIKNDANQITFKELLLLIEQVFKIILKLNQQIPATDKIKHKLIQIGYNQRVTSS